jgi:hypothetical protein
MDAIYQFFDDFWYVYGTFDKLISKLYCKVLDFVTQTVLEQIRPFGFLIFGLQISLDDLSKLALFRILKFFRNNLSSFLLFLQEFSPEDTLGHVLKSGKTDF